MSYFTSLHRSWVARNAADPPRIGWLLITIFSLVVLYLIASVNVVPSDEVAEFNFSDERGSVTVLSAIFLAMGSAFAFVAFYYSPDFKDRIFWIGLTGAMGFLAMDELLQFHERLGGFMERRQEMNTELFRRWNDVIVIAYGAIALVLLLFFLPTALKYPRLLELFGVAFLFYAIHTAIDSTQEPSTPTSIMFEESAKLFCAASLAVALFAGLSSVLNRIKA